MWDARGGSTFRGNSAASRWGRIFVAVKQAPHFNHFAVRRRCESSVVRIRYANVVITRYADAEKVRYADPFFVFFFCCHSAAKVGSTRLGGVIVTRKSLSSSRPSVTIAAGIDRSRWDFGEDEFCLWIDYPAYDLVLRP